MVNTEFLKLTDNETGENIYIETQFWKIRRITCV